MKPLLTIVAACALTAPTLGQSFNIDIGPAGSTPPPDTYAAAGAPGQWISVPAEWGVDYTNLVDVDGTVTAASFTQIGGTETLPFVDPSVAGDDATLMNDALITHTTIENCMFLEGMEPGSYEVLIYAWMPANPAVLANTDVDEEPLNPQVLVGGAWPGQHQNQITYAHHTAEVAESGPSAGRLGLHSGVPAGGDFDIGAALNGVQIRKVDPVAGDVDGDFDVDVNDLLELLATWGSCPGCPGDLDGDDRITVSDLLILLANWT